MLKHEKKEAHRLRIAVAYLLLWDVQVRVSIWFATWKINRNFDKHSLVPIITVPAHIIVASTTCWELPSSLQLSSLHRRDIQQMLEETRLINSHGWSFSNDFLSHDMSSALQSDVLSCGRNIPTRGGSMLSTHFRSHNRNSGSSWHTCWLSCSGAATMPSGRFAHVRISVLGRDESTY